MKKEIADLWVAALKSGKYKQTTQQLRSPEGFCCLGVLCNLHAIAHPKIAAKQKSLDEYMRQSSILPRQVMKWAGMKTQRGELNVKNDFSWHKDSLMNLNDYEELTFKQIAQVIAQEWEQL